jgi:hypothetical protein
LRQAETKSAPIVGVIDIGSPRSGKLGWVVLDGDDESYGNDLDEFITAFAVRCDGRPAALGFEAPLFIPVRDKAINLTSARRGEGSRPWSAAAGANALAIAIPIVAYTLTKLRPLLKDYTAVVDPNRWGLASNTLLLFEAFVTGASKAQHHHEDAAIAARAFVAGCGDLAALNAINETDVVSLCGLALIYSGWVEPSFDIVTSPLLVVKP